ncbi:5-methylcytosine-specific restriction enzyme subunit McrC [Acidovorax delafieldii]|uniref:McrC family protein n=1 Tax=Acidovorax delafieldii TaxID=47920 RepID=UPI002857FA6E|nr:McrC family protein [Acidovorax delafieldii]MDR6154189.1 5-methylcytosine-specific restriction enzyme subunit McrC [Acidovorax delafieldii]
MTRRPKTVQVREHAWLCTEAVAPTLDCAQISPSAFDYLCQLSERFSRSGARLAQVEGRQRLKLDNYVGVLQTPCGTVVEIVPKHHAEGGSLPEARALLRKLLLALLDVPAREVGPAALQLFDAPLSEWVMQQFLQALDVLLGRGLRMNYMRVEEELPFLRGQLNLNAQLRQPPGKGHYFHVRHDLYGPDRPENRLLKLALERVRQATQSPENWRLAQELSVRLHEVPPSRQVTQDFRAWGTDRLLAHYRAVKPWCELILQQHMPLAISGEHQGLSLLFPMEKLFERYVARWLRCALASGVEMRAPARSQSLCMHDGASIFQLEPDFFLTQGGRRWVLDTKWKLLNAADRSSKYGLSQSDFYQLYAYGQKYMGGAGCMALIYPQTEQFPKPLEPFHFDARLSLWVLPFMLEAEQDMEGLLGWQYLGLPLACEGTETSAVPMMATVLEG